MVDEQKLREVAQAAINGDDCAYDILCDDLGSGVIVLALLDELQTLREERTAWRVTAENAEAKAAALMEIDAMRAAHGLDAARYQWLRSQNWEGNMIGVLIHPKDNARLGSFLPSEDLLDAAIDASMKDES